MSNMDRRDFLKAVATGAAAVAGAGLLTGCTPQPSGTSDLPAAQPNSEPPAASNPAPVPVEKNWDQECDVVVAGGGLGGLCAAIAAAENGANVTLVEASALIGGTSTFTGGVIHVWGAETFEELLARAPLTDPVLGKVLLDNWDAMFKWLHSMPVPWGPNSMLGQNSVQIGSTYEEKQASVDAMANYFESMGGKIQYRTKAAKLFADDMDRVIGIRVLKEDKTYADIKAKAVILANGGFQNNPEMKVKYYGPYADVAVARCVPYNQGEALLMATEVGALSSRNFATAYGHVQPYPCLVPQTEEEYEKFDRALLLALMSSVQNYTPSSIAVNIYGKRFIDESLGDDLLNFEICRQEEGRVFIIVDAEKAEPALSSINLIKDNGGVVETADTIKELVEKIGAYRYDTIQLQDTIDEYNRAIDKNNTKSLPIARAGNLVKLATPPFYAVQATAGISGPYGGIKIDTRAQVLGRNDNPIPGLYAVPHAAGGIYSKHYGGSLGLCAGFGRIAGLSVTQDI